MPNPGVVISGKKLREVRLDRRMTTSQLAEALGCTGAYVRQMELDIRKPSIDMIGKLEKALSVTANELEAKITG